MWAVAEDEGYSPAEGTVLPGSRAYEKRGGSLKECAGEVQNCYSVRTVVQIQCPIGIFGCRHNLGYNRYE